MEMEIQTGESGCGYIAKRFSSLGGASAFRFLYGVDKGVTLLTRQSGKVGMHQDSLPAGPRKGCSVYWYHDKG
jgi:hypothetical protein